MTKKTTENIPKKNVEKKKEKPVAVKQSKAEKVNTPADKVVKKKVAEPKESSASPVATEWRSPVAHARSTSRVKKIRGRLS